MVAAVGLDELHSNDPPTSCVLSLLKLAVVVRSTGGHPPEVHVRNLGI
jgi:hypothetical protein